MSKQKIKKPFYKKWWVWVIAIIIIFAIFGNDEEDGTNTATDSGSNTETADSKSTTPNKENKKANKEENKIAGVGDTVKVGDVEFTVNSTSTAKNVGGEWGANSQGTFLLVNVTVNNAGNEAITIDSSFFALKAGEKTYDADGSAGIYANDGTGFFLEKINPDLSATGVVVFDVSDEVINNPELQMQVQSGFWGTETGLINIAK